MYPWLINLHSLPPSPDLIASTTDFLSTTNTSPPFYFFLFLFFSFVISLLSLSPEYSSILLRTPPFTRRSLAISYLPCRIPSFASSSPPGIRPSCGLHLHPLVALSLWLLSRPGLRELLCLSVRLLWCCFDGRVSECPPRGCFSLSSPRFILHPSSHLLLSFVLLGSRLHLSTAGIMWLYRGVQSAIFYYAACTPCANSIDRRKRLNDAIRSKREREKCDALVTDQPRPFPQPIPFSTNPGWNEEIALGPGPPARNHRALNRRANSWNTDGLSGSSMDADVGNLSQKKEKGSSRDRWNRMRYQREDELLWGQGRGKAEAKGSSKYHIARVPPVNDLHPPIVSGPKSRAETRWMLQPPPSARIMEGKERSHVAVRCSPPGSARIDEEDNETALPGPAGRKSPNEHKQQQQSQAPCSSVSEKKTLKPSPLSICPDYHAQKASDPELRTRLPRRPPSTLQAHGRDESNFVIASPSEPPSPLSSPADSEGGSPSLSLRCPETPVSRPVSKATDESGKPRPTISKTLSTLHRDHHATNTNKVHLLRLEINDPPEEVGMGQFDQIRPYRWSMDI